MHSWHFSFILTACILFITANPALVIAEEPLAQPHQSTLPTEPYSEITPLTEQPLDTYAETDFLDEILNEIDHQHQSLSEEIVEFTDEIDTFFISDDQEKRINYSHIQLGYRYTFYKDDPTQIDPIFQARVHLPRTQNRLTLEISNNNPFDPINNTATSTSTGNSNPTDQTLDDQALNIGLGYARKFSELFNTKLTGGTRLAGNKVNLFINLQFYRKFFFEKWSLHLSEDLYRDNIVFSRATTQMLFERTISDDQLFQSITKNIHYYDLGYTQNHQTFYVFDQLSSRDAIIYQVGSMWERPLDLLGYELENYYAMVRYSRKIYRDWLFMEVSPQVHYLKAEDFHPKPLIALQFTAFFGNNK